MIRAGLVDAFTDRPFGGNPAAVVYLDASMPNDAWLQALATEFNVSETVFVWPLNNGDSRLRWFTPSAEVELCGHATWARARGLALTTSKCVVLRSVPQRHGRGVDRQPLDSVVRNAVSDQVSAARPNQRQPQELGRVPRTQPRCPITQGRCRRIRRLGAVVALDNADGGERR